MQLLINIDEEDYNNLVEQAKKYPSNRIQNNIINGTPYTPAIGHWIDDCPIMTDEGLVRVIRCSRCNEQRKDYYGVSKDYCSKCGTKMEGENT